MPHPRLLDSRHSALLVIDIQEAFRHVVLGFPEMAARTSIAVRAFQLLSRPVFVTEQYPKGLGRTVEEILFSLPVEAEIFEKTAFSSCGAGKLVELLKASLVRQVAVCGLETQVCVNQTVHDLIELGYDVHILTDCVGSRTENDRSIGLAKMFGSGAVPSTLEMALFELMRDSTHEQFKEIQAMLK